MSEHVKDIGVDVEELDRNVRLDALAKHAFHPDEYETWLSLEQDREYWFKVWTIKEAVLKASGLGIRLDLNTLNTQAHPIDQRESVLIHLMGYLLIRILLLTI